MPLNGTQLATLEAVIDGSTGGLTSIEEAFTEKPDVLRRTLSLCLSPNDPLTDCPEIAEKDLTEAVQSIRDILAHPCPQNRKSSLLDGDGDDGVTAFLTYTIMLRLEIDKQSKIIDELKDYKKFKVECLDLVSKGSEKTLYQANSKKKLFEEEKDELLKKISLNEDEQKRILKLTTNLEKLEEIISKIKKDLAKIKMDIIEIDIKLLKKEYSLDRLKTILDQILSDSYKDVLYAIGFDQVISENPDYVNLANGNQISTSDIIVSQLDSEERLAGKTAFIAEEELGILGLTCHGPATAEEVRDYVRTKINEKLKALKASPAPQSNISKKPV
jgi:hypothetical protein